MNKRYLPYTLAGLAILAVIYWSFSDSGSQDTTDITIKPRTGEFRVTVTCTGELQAKNSISIFGPSSATSAGIWQLKLTNLVDEGTVVNAGDIVAEIDKSDLAGKIKEVQLSIQKAESQFTQAQLDTTLTLSQARDDLINMEYSLEEKELVVKQSKFEAPSVQRQAEIDLERQKRTFEQSKKNYRTKVQQSIAKMSEVEAELSSHRQKLSVYMDILQQFTIRAPSEGMVIYAKEWNGRKKVVGSTISSWNPIVATLPDLSVMESVTYVNEVDIQKIEAGLSVEVGLDADHEKKLTGTITQIANVGEQRPNSDSKVFEVKILVNESDTTLRPSMTTSNEIVVATVDSALAVPLECIHADDDLVYVYKQNGSGILKQQIEIGLINDDEAIINRGLTQEDEIYLSIPDVDGSSEFELALLDEREPETLQAQASTH